MLQKAAHILFVAGLMFSCFPYRKMKDVLIICGRTENAMWTQKQNSNGLLHINVSMCVSTKYKKGL